VAGSPLLCVPRDEGRRSGPQKLRSEALTIPVEKAGVAGDVAGYHRVVCCEIRVLDVLYPEYRDAIVGGKGVGASVAHEDDVVAVRYQVEGLFFHATAVADPVGGRRPAGAAGCVTLIAGVAEADRRGEPAPGAEPDLGAQPEAAGFVEVDGGLQGRDDPRGLRREVGKPADDEPLVYDPVFVEVDVPGVGGEVPDGAIDGDGEGPRDRRLSSQEDYVGGPRLLRYRLQGVPDLVPVCRIGHAGAVIPQALRRVEDDVPCIKPVGPVDRLDVPVHGVFEGCRIPQEAGRDEEDVPGPVLHTDVDHPRALAGDGDLPDDPARPTDPFSVGGADADELGAARLHDVVPVGRYVRVAPLRDRHPKAPGAAGGRRPGAPIVASEKGDGDARDRVTGLLVGDPPLEGARVDYGSGVGGPRRHGDGQLRGGLIEGCRRSGGRENRQR